MRLPRKRWLFCGMAIALLASAAGWPCILLRPGRVTPENYLKVRPGMTDSEVLAILGKPWHNALFDREPPSVIVTSPSTLAAGTFDDGKTIEELVCIPGTYLDFSGPSPSLWYWYGKGAMFGVVFDKNRRVLAKGSELIPEEADPSLAKRAWKRVRRRLGW